MPQPCPCGSGLDLQLCCERLHAGEPAATAELLMRSRYCAYVLGHVDYLVATTLPAQQSSLDKEAIGQWSRHSTWLGLTVDRYEPATDIHGHDKVTFSVRWQDTEGSHSYQECSVFVQRQGRWYFIDPTVPLTAKRNDPCPCGSTGKFKKCCATYCSAKS